MEEISSRDWLQSYSKNIQTHSVTSLERGKILFFPQLPFLLLDHEHKFLSTSHVHAKTKNISFNSLNNVLRGSLYKGKELEELRSMLKRFANSAETLVKQILAPYQQALQIGRTSFRPVEISGRVSSYRKDDTRLHVDSFPATPNQGRRILRVFTNINPNNQNRVWRVGEPFEDVALRFLPKIQQSWQGKSTLLKLLRITKSYRTQYDHIMLNIHDNMKADLTYQKEVPQSEIHFVPGNTWIVQTDHVSHAAMSGQHLLEQTFYLPVNAMLNQDLSPLRTLEKLCGKKLI